MKFSFRGFFSNIFKKDMEKALNQSQKFVNTSNQATQEQVRMNILQKYMMSPFSQGSVNKFLVYKYFDVTDAKEEMQKEIDQLKNFYMSQLIVNRIKEDALTPTIDNDFFKVSVEIDGEVDNSLTEICKELTKKLSIKKILLDISDDLLFYGEVFLRLDVVNYKENYKEKGVINIHDDVDNTKIIPVFRDSEIGYFLTVDLDKKDLVTVPNVNYIYFYNGGNRIKVKINGLDDKALYVRSGQSILYPVLGLLKELYFLENLMPVAMINGLRKTKIVGVSVPEATKAVDAAEIARVYQKMIDTAFAADDNYQDLDQLLDKLQSQIGKVKVIPVWNDKGQLQSQDLENNQNLDDIQNKIQDLRELILRTLGLPVNLITQDQDILKSDIIKSYNMYVKKLKQFQESLAFGLKQLYTIHLQNLGFTNIKLENIKIHWNNTIDYDSLQKVELIDVMIAVFDNINRFIDDFDNNENIEVNKKEYVNFLNSQFQNVVGFSLFKYKEDEEE